jgi:outer membrane protein insertion porin family
LTAVSQDNGEPAQVWNVKIKGNKQYSDMVLHAQIATEEPSFWKKIQFWDNRTGHPLDEIKIKKDVIRIGNFYRRRGYINVGVSYQIKTENKEWKKKVIFEIDENAPVMITALDYQIDTKGADTENVRQRNSFQKAKRQQPFKVGTRYQPINEAQVIGQFTEVFKNLGFAYATVSIQSQIDTSRLAARITIQANLGPKTYIDSIRVEGLGSLTKSYLLEEAVLDTGQVYSLNKLQEAQQQLFNHHLIRFATISIPPQPQDSTLTLLLRVRENEPRSVSLLFGFGTEELLRGQVSWIHRNAFGRGHRFTVTARASFIEQSLNLDYLFPYFLNTKSSIVISPFAQHLLQENFELLRAGVTNSYIYRYSQNFTASAAYEFTKNKELSQQFETSLPDTTTQYDLSSLQFSSYYTSGFGRLQEGWVIQPYVEISGLFDFATYRFQKLTADIRRYTSLSNSTMLAMRVQAGGLFSVSVDSLPRQIRFYLGGTNSVRGWTRQELGPKRALVDSSGFIRYVPLGGRAKFGFNIEIRQDLSFLIKGIGVAFFLDGGQVWRSVDGLGSRPIQFGIGGGIRYQSPIGPIRVDIGYKLNPTNEDLNFYNGQNFGSAWDRIGIHFSIGQAF